MNTDNRFRFKLTNFHSNLETGFYDLLQREVMVDVSLVTDEGKILKAHKTILSISSIYFQEIFNAHDCKHPIIILKNVGYQEMANMLDFMYKGEVIVQQANLASFLKLGETLKVKDLIGGRQDNAELPVSSLEAQGKSSACPVCESRTATLMTNFSKSDSNDSTYKSRRGDELPKKIEGFSSPKFSIKAYTDKSSNNFSVTPRTKAIPLSTQIQLKSDPEEIILTDDDVEVDDSLSQFVLSQGTDRTNQQDYAKFDDALKDSNSHNLAEMDVDMTAGHSGNPDKSTKQGYTGRKRGRKPDLIWKYFDKNPKRTVCKDCGKIYKGDRTNRSCMLHLKKKHPKLYKILAAKKEKIGIGRFG